MPYCSEEPADRDKYLLHDGDIVISRAGSVGYSHLVKNPQSAVFASYLIRFKPSINEQYVAYFLQSPSYWQAISEQSLGIAIPNVNASKLKQIDIPVAPPAEQPRIVAKIEEQFTRLDAGVAALKRAQANLKRYKAAVLKAACEGKLTDPKGLQRPLGSPSDEPASELLKRILAERRVKWAADLRAKGKDPQKAKYEEPQAPDLDVLPELPSGWCWAVVDTVAKVISGCAFDSKDFCDEGVPAIKISNVSYGEFIWKQQEYLAEEFLQKYREYQVLPDTILLALTRPITDNTVKVCLYPSSAPVGLLNQRVAMLIPFDGYVKSFLAYLIQSEFFKQQIKGGMSETLQPNLSPLKLQTFAVPLPPLAEQRRIVAEVERRLSVVQELEATLTANLARAERLRQSILKRAFEGKL